jgi:phosphatidylglycerophosphatase A
MNSRKPPLRLSQFAGSPADRIAFWSATFFGTGLFPVAPGTAGTLAGLPLVAAATTLPISTQIAIWTFTTVLGSWAAARVDSRAGTGDHGSIVIDEVIGLGISAMACRMEWMHFAVAFALFRFFDITKIPPVRQVDTWSKRKALEAGALWGGFGVMLDDILAGLQALAVFIFLTHYGWLP